MTCSNSNLGGTFGNFSKTFKKVQTDFSAQNVYLKVFELNLFKKFYLITVAVSSSNLGSMLKNLTVMLVESIRCWLTNYICKNFGWDMLKQFYHLATLVS